MKPAICMKSKVETLKKLETYAFQVAYYILQDEYLAIEATKYALLEVFKEDDGFYRKALPVQRDIMKKIMIKQSIAVKKNHPLCAKY